MLYSTIATLFSFALASNAVSVPQNEITNAVKPQSWNNLILNLKVTNQLPSKKDLLLTIEATQYNPFNFKWLSKSPRQQAIKYTSEAVSTDFFYEIVDCPSQYGCVSDI
eukprot:Pgem_evm1s19705